jgi:hypothetical protein
MLVEYAGIWFVPTKGDDSYAILVKAKTNIIKAIIKGCEVKVSFALSESPKGRILVSCLQIYDDQATPITVANPHTRHSEQETLVAILTRGNVPFFLFDELNRNVAWAECRLDSPSKEKVLRLINTPETLYEGELDVYVTEALDNLQYTVDPTIKFDTAVKLPLVLLPLQLNQFQYSNIYGYSLSDGIQQFNIIDNDEGGGLEQSIWQLIDDLFAGNTYRSPQVVSGDNLRELTDVLAITDKGTFLFEAKAIGILNTSLERSSSRKAKGLEGQIKKALKQLIGAIKTVKNGEQILSKAGKPIEFNREIVPHCIVLVSEMFPFGNWSEISRLVAEASCNYSAMFHVIDLSELLIMVGSSDTAYHLDYFFMKRFEILAETGNALFRMRFQR